MKSKKTLMGLVLLIGILVLGIGYATISTINLTINGTASASAEGTFIVQFDNTKTITKNTYVDEASVKQGAGQTVGEEIYNEATFTVSGMKAKGDSTTIVFPITSEMEEDLQAALAVGAITNTNETYFSVSAEITENQPDVLTNTVTESSVTVTVELIKTPLESEETATITIPLTATPSVVTSGS